MLPAAKDVITLPVDGLTVLRGSTWARGREAKSVHLTLRIKDPGTHEDSLDGLSVNGVDEFSSDEESSAGRKGRVSDGAFAMGRGELVPRHEIRPTHLKDDLPFHDSSLNS